MMLMIGTGMIGAGFMQRTSTSSPAASRRPGQLDLLQAQSGPGALFAYGTLQFPGVLSALLRRVPEHAAGTAVGWRAAALAARNYPGMVRAGRATATGILITGLTPAEWRLIDTYEDDFYELRQLTLADGRRGWTYAWVNHAEVAAHDWSAPDFVARHLAEFTERCRAWRQRYDTTGQPGHVTGHPWRLR
jgi:gamma-glutamylcyclotransferase (GGCT)/AIG2-like uncharacterized protein YtfP